MPAPLPQVDLVHAPPYGEVPFKHLGLAYVAAGLRARGIPTRYHDVSERFHRKGDDFYDDLILRLSRRAGEMSDLPFLDLLGEVLFPEHGDSALAARIRGQVDWTVERLGEARVVGVSFNTLTSYFAIALGRVLRRRGVRVFMGGPLSRVAPLVHLMLRLQAADVVVAGEGDLVAAPVVRALVEGTDLSAIPGTTWLAPGGTVVETPGELVSALDALPWPELEGNVLDQFIPLQASRGCGRHCHYCSEKGIWGTGGYRRRDVSLVVEEMRARAGSFGMTDFHFHDDLLNGSPQWMESFVAAVSRQGFTWESFFEPYGLDEPLLSRMASAGCRLVKFGVQSFSPSVLKSMGRAPRVQAIVEAVIATYRAGMSTHYDMLIGHPGETEEDHQTNLRAVEELYDRTGDKLYFSLNPFYLAVGSEIERNPGRFGVELRMADPAQLPPPLAEAVAAGPAYPVGYRAALSRDTIMRRMGELAAILRKHGKDYLYLGQDRVPDAGARGRRMLPPLPEDVAVENAAAEAKRRGDALRVLPVIMLNERSNFRIWPEPGGLRSMVPPGAPAVAAARAMLELPRGAALRLAGGEPTLSEQLPELVAAARRGGINLTVESNGARFGHRSYARALARMGLAHAVVLLLGTQERAADVVAGVDGGFALACRGIDALLDAGVQVEVGLVPTEHSELCLARFVAFVHARWPSVRAVRVVFAQLRGEPSVLGLATSRRQALLERLVADATKAGMQLTWEERDANASRAG